MDLNFRSVNIQGSVLWEKYEIHKTSQDHLAIPQQHMHVINAKQKELLSFRQNVTEFWS